MLPQINATIERPAIMRRSESPPSTCPHLRTAGRVRFKAALLAVALLAGGSVPAQGGLLVGINDLTVAPGSGSFDITLQVTGGPYDIAAFTVGLGVANNGGTGFQFVDPVQSADSPAGLYLFGSTAGFPPVGTNGSVATDGQSLTAFDFYNSSPPDPTANLSVSDGTYTLAHVAFVATTTGTVTVAFDSIGTSFSDALGNLLPLDTTSSGGPIPIDVQGNGIQPVPEPSTLLMAGISAVALLFIHGKRLIAPRRRPYSSEHY